jgi:hypothetical protein
VEPCTPPGGRANERSSSASNTVPSRITTAAVTVSDPSERGMPTTAASATSGCSSSAFSTSLGLMLNPPLMISS